MLEIAVYDGDSGGSAHRTIKLVVSRLRCAIHSTKLNNEMNKHYFQVLEIQLKFLCHFKHIEALDYGGNLRAVCANVHEKNGDI